METLDRIRSVREAGRVERCHLVPHLKEYNNAMHQWGVACLCRILWPEERQLVDFAMFHDVPERWTGDIPGQFLSGKHALRESLEHADTTIMEGIGLPCEHSMPLQDWLKLRAADKLELWLWTWEEEAMGNRMVLGIRKELDKMFDASDAEGNLPKEVVAVLSEQRALGWKRMGEKF